ncbi:hypothetical protein ACFLTD_01155, partial [Elusimicrobiota bacterium]
SMLRGNIAFSSVAAISAFFATIIITPWLTSQFIESGIIKTSHIMVMLGQLIIIPMILGRILNTAGLKKYLIKLHGPAVNIGFGIIFSVIFGVNRHMFYSNPYDLIKLTALFFTAIFGTAFAIKYVAKKLNLSKDTTVSIILVATIKNSIFGATAGLTLIGPQAAFPGTVMSFITIAYLIFIQKILDR